MGSQILQAIHAHFVHCTETSITHLSYQLPIQLPILSQWVDQWVVILADG